jgi:hypothetical protein
LRVFWGIDGAQSYLADCQAIRGEFQRTQPQSHRRISWTAAKLKNVW